MQKLALIVLAALFISGCQREVSPREFFEKRKIKQPDYGVMKNGNDHVITIHGFYDNLTNCLEIAELFNRKASGTYTCAALNH